MNTFFNLPKPIKFILPCICFIFISEIGMATKADTLRFYSNAMQQEMPAAVVLPGSYDELDEDFPVLYLLHGGNGNFLDWLTNVPDKELVQKMADQYNIIIVTPDGGELSYYFDSPTIKNSQYMSYISRDLRNEIDNRYRTINEKRGRVIAGLSMGGHGAFYIAAKNPELYSAAGSMSGVMDINTETWDVPDEFRQRRRSTFEELLGQPGDTENPYREYTAVGLTDLMKENGLHLIFDCGVDDFLIETNRSLHKKLLQNGTPHDYIERPGGHTWEYWQNALPYQMLFFYQVLKSNGSAIE